MPLVDNRGRVRGRFNLIDVLVAMFLLALVPLAYGAFLLFRQPMPSLVVVTPATLPPHVTRVQAKGRNLRPYLRVSFNQTQGTTFGFIDAETAVIDVPELAPGTYDVILYDVAREVSRLPGALAVEGPAVPLSTQATMLVTGRFVGLDKTVADSIQPTSRLTALAGNSLEVLSRGEAGADRRWFNIGEYRVETPLSTGVQVPALVRAACTVAEKRCQFGGRDIEPGLSLNIFSAANKPLRFEITDAAAEGVTTLVEFRGGFVVPTESLDVIHAGDRARRDPLLGDRVPLLVQVGTARSATAALTLPAPPGIAGPGEWGLEVSENASMVEATVRLRADVTSEGLHYRGRPLRAGAPFVFEHERYVLRGWIRALRPLPEPNGDR